MEEVKKPLELKVYPKLPPPPSREDYGPYEYRLYAAAWDAWAGPEYRIPENDKRLTDAELAAEFHAEAGRFCCDMSHPNEARLDAIERFATHDHYDEGDS